MDDIVDVVCGFCGSIMGLSREVAASADTHALRFFSCETCGASELRIDRGSGDSIDPGGRDA
jgi:Zn finger protein HypA/HybF involved in hydrogenase expression